MGLDLYVGSLTRYYMGSPVAVIEQMARQQRVPYAIVHDARGPDSGQEFEPVVRSAALAWREGLRQQLDGRLDEPLDWDESPGGPCYTDKPGWDAYGGVLLLAAHQEYPELPLPHEVSADWADDPAYLASLETGSGSRFDQVLIPDLWLPCRFGFTFRTRDLTGQEIEVGSIAMLRTQLEALRAAHHADPSPLAVIAHRALAVIRRMADRATRHGLPMKLDF